MKRSIILLVMMSGVLLTTPTHATLWDRGGGLIYDDVLNITWLQDSNYAKTSGYGGMNWAQATTWAANLVYGGYSDWRLPKTVDGPYVIGYNGTTTAGYNITSSEMGYMYYVNLANKGLYDTSGNSPQSGWSVTPNATFTDGNGNTVSFLNLGTKQPIDYYWSGTEYSSDPSLAWLFFFNVGTQAYGYKTGAEHPAWAVRDGDVAPVPEPSTLLLLGSGLVGLIGYGRKKIRK